MALAAIVAVRRNMAAAVAAVRGSDEMGGQHYDHLIEGFMAEGFSFAEANQLLEQEVARYLTTPSDEAVAAAQVVFGDSWEINSELWG